MVSKIFMDPEFQVLEKEFLDNDIDMECVAAQEHVPEVERTIRVIKEQFRAQYHRLPYQRIPILMIEVLAQECGRWLNMFPPKGGASNYYAPMTIVMGRTLDYKKYCKYTFGSYVQALHENNPTNTVNPRTIECIYLQTRYAEHTVHKLMNLNTGKIISRRKITEIPATEEVIARVEELAKGDKM